MSWRRWSPRECTHTHTHTHTHMRGDWFIVTVTCTSRHLPRSSSRPCVIRGKSPNDASTDPRCDCPRGENAVARWRLPREQPDRTKTYVNDHRRDHGWKVGRYLSWGRQVKSMYTLAMWYWILLNFTEFEKYLKIHEFYWILNVHVLNSQFMVLPPSHAYWYKIGQFRDVVPSQSVGVVMK